MKDEVDFLPKDKQNFQIDTIILGVCGQACQKLPKITSLLFLCNSLRKKWVMKLILAWKFPINWYYDFDGDNSQKFPIFF